MITKAKLIGYIRFTWFYCCSVVQPLIWSRSFWLWTRRRESLWMKLFNIHGSQWVFCCVILSPQSTLMRFCLKTHTFRCTLQRSKTLSVFIENADIWKRSPEWRHLKTDPIVLAWTAKTEAFENVEVIHIANIAGASICRSVFQRFSVDGENAAKTIVWMRSFWCVFSKNRVSKTH